MTKWSLPVLLADVHSVIGVCELGEAQIQSANAQGSPKFIIAGAQTPKIYRASVSTIDARVLAPCHLGL
jgi:hypothetical protein